MSVFRQPHNYRRPARFIPTAPAVAQDTSLAVKQRQVSYALKERPTPKAPAVLTDRAPGIIYKARQHQRAQEYFAAQPRKFIPSLAAVVADTSLLFKKPGRWIEPDWILPKRIQYLNPEANPSLLYKKDRVMWAGEEWRQAQKRVILTAPQANTSLIYRQIQRYDRLKDWFHPPKRVLISGTTAPPNQSFVYKTYTDRAAVLEIIRQLEAEQDYHYKVKYEPNLFTVAAPPTPLAIAVKARQYAEEEFYDYWRQRHYRLDPVVFADQWVLFEIPDNVKLALQPRWQLHFFETGTSTYSNVSALGNGSLLHADVVVLDRYGTLPTIYTDSEVTYDVSIRNQYGIERYFIEGY